MLVLRIALPLDVPILDCSNDMAFICRAKLNFGLVALQGLGSCSRRSSRPARGWMRSLSFRTRAPANSGHRRFDVEPIFLPNSVGRCSQVSSLDIPASAGTIQAEGEGRSEER